MDKIITYNSINEIKKEEWKKLLDSSPYANFFQSPECYDFYSSLSFLKPFVFGVEENNKLAGIIVGYIIADGSRVKKFFSRRAIVPGGFMVSDNISEEALTALLETIKSDLKRKAIYIEFRNYKDYSTYKSILKKNQFEYQAHLNFHVRTDDVESSMKQLSSTKRRDVRVSLRNGAEIVELKEEKDLRAYYKILFDLYSTRIKLPLFPYEFFEKLANNREAKLFGVKYKDEVIGGSVCVVLENKIIYEWFVCGLDGMYKNIYPSTLATWAAIEFASENGYKYFDMMGAGKPNEGYGVREFKSKFGGKLVEHGRFLNIINPFLYKLGKKVIAIIQKR